MNTGISFLFFFWILAPILYCAYYDLITHSDTDDTTQSLIRTTLLTSPFLPGRFSTILEQFITPKTSSPMAFFDQAKYESYSPVFLPVTRALALGIGLATFPALVVHTYGELNT